MTRSKRRGGAKHHNSSDENWIYKPIHSDNQSQNQKQLQDEQSNLDSSSFPSTSSQSGTNSPKSQINPSRVSRSRSKYASNQQFMENSENEASKSPVGLLNTGLNCAISEPSSSKAVDFSSSSEVGSSNCGNESNKERRGEYEPEDEVYDVVSRLGKLHLGVKEPELAEEQLMINDQLQEDELLVMESIFGDNVVMLHKQGEQRSFQIYINLNLPAEFMVLARFNTSGDLKIKRESTDDEFLFSFKVQYLPPIEMTCLLPKSYPSHLPPLFTISVQWLDSSKISSLCSMLDSIWMEQPGQEVIYQWVEWLQNSSLSHLGIDNEITLGPYGIKYGGDMRAVSTGVSLDVDVPLLRSYNDERCHENFLKNLHECLICYNEYAGSDFIRLPCHHFFCSNCMKTYSDIHVSEGSVNKLKCPDTKCGGMIPPGLLKQLLGDEEYERWESLTLQKTLDSMSDIEYCPRCQTPCIEDKDNHAQCSKCFFSFCTLCRERWHAGVECLTPELRLRILEGRQNSSQLQDGQRRKELEMINEILSVKEVLRDAKQCPTCKLAISKTGGCNKMVCQNCGQYFCYRCNKAIDGYDHFRDGGCELFPQEAIREWDNQMNARRIIGQAQAQAQLLVEHGFGNTCPGCGQLNAKVGNNNHISCWACQTHFCYLCREIVRRGSRHFGPKGCKQHTVD